MRPVQIACSLAVALCLAGCALPKLPSMTDIKEAAGVGSSGDSARDAVNLATGTIDAWSVNAQLIDVRGTRIDGGGRDHGFRDGQWLIEVQSADKKAGYQIVVQNGKVTTTATTTYQDDAVTIDRALTGIQDSTDIIAKAALNAHSYTVILRGGTPNARYDVLGEGAATSVTLDAITGDKVTQ